MFRALLLTSVVAAAAFLNGTNVQADDDKHHEHFLKCAKACADCQVQCDGCFHHCAELVAKGKKEHAKAMHNCVDCADCCALAAKLTARHSPFSAAACECCAKCTDQCATECERFPDDKHMADCAKSCRNAVKECRAMIKHLAP